MLDILFQKLKPIVPERWHWVLEHGGFKRYFANTGWMFFGQFFNMAVAFFVGAYIARYLGPKNFGLMNYAISFASLFGFLAGFGVDSILNRELVKYPEKKDELMNNSFWLKLFGGLLAIIVINSVSVFTGNDAFARLLIFIYSLSFIFQSFTIVTIYFQSQVLSKKVVLVQLIITFLSTLLKLSFIYLHLGVIWITAIYVFDSINLATGLMVIYYKNRKKWFFQFINPDLIKLLLKDSIPLMFTIITVVIYAKIDQIMLKYMMDVAAVGIYVVGVKLSEVWYFIPGIICASLFPAIINAKKTNQEIYLRRLGNLYRLMIFLAVIVAIPLTFAAFPIINILFGHEYISAARVLQIYIWGGVPVFFMAAIGQYLLTENYTKIYFITTFLGATSNIVLNMVLIPKFGINGSAIATLISYSLVPLSLIIFPQTKNQLFIIFKKSKA